MEASRSDNLKMYSISSSEDSEGESTVITSSAFFFLNRELRRISRNKDKKYLCYIILMLIVLISDKSRHRKETCHRLACARYVKHLTAEPLKRTNEPTKWYYFVSAYVFLGIYISTQQREHAPTSTFFSFYQKMGAPPRSPSVVHNQLYRTSFTRDVFFVCVLIKS